MEEFTTTVNDQILDNFNLGLSYAVKLAGTSRHEDIVQSAVVWMLVASKNNPELNIKPGYMTQSVRSVFLRQVHKDRKISFTGDETLLDHFDNRSYRIEQDYEHRETIEGIRSLVSEEAWDVINLVSEGYEAQEIAEKLGISRRKVTYHIERVRKAARASS